MTAAAEAARLDRWAWNREGRIPGADNAVIDEAKIRDYLLSSGHRVGSAKAKFFSQIGFEQQDWIVLEGERFPRFVTAYPGAPS